MKKEITPKTFPKAKPIMSDFPPHLKDHANFQRIQIELYDAGGSTCTHREVAEFAVCQKCQDKQLERSRMMQKLGFKSGAHYLTWLKIHNKIDSTRRDPIRELKK